MRSLLARLTLTIVAIIVATGSLTAADRVRNAVEKADDRSGYRQAARGVADDRADLDRLSDLVMQWKDMKVAGADQRSLRGIESRIAAQLRSDVKESAREVKQAEKEVRQSRRELRSDRREVRSNRNDADATVAQRRDDRRDRRDDRRDLKDDIRDREQAERLLEQKRQIAEELISLQRDSGEFDGFTARQEALLEDYLELSRQEIALGVREMTEDRRELREDRRETREDRRQS